MDALDADDKTLSDGSRKAVRDIVQFVSFRDFNSGHDIIGNQVSDLLRVFASVYLSFLVALLRCSLPPVLKWSIRANFFAFRVFFCPLNALRRD